MLRYSGHALLLVLGAIFVFHSPFSRWWAERNLPWYTVFLFWLVLIILVAIDNYFSGSNSKRGTDSKGERDGD